jgi:hypothetical protein
VKGWVIAHSVDLVASGERAFVQQLGDPEPNRLTHSADSHRVVVSSSGPAFAGASED